MYALSSMQVQTTSGEPEAVVFQTLARCNGFGYNQFGTFNRACQLSERV